MSFNHRWTHNNKHFGRASWQKNNASWWFNKFWVTNVASIIVSLLN